MSKQSHGDNVTTEVKGNKLIIEVDLKKEFGESKSGKNITIGSTRGNSKIRLSDDSEITIGLNCYRSNPNR